MSTKQIDIKNGRVFPEPFRFYLLVGIILISTIVAGEVIGLVFLLIPILGISARRGTQFKGASYRRYFSVFGLKLGFWEQVKEGEALVLLGLHMRSQFGSYGGLLSTKEEKVWTLYLVDAKHRNKRDLGISLNKEELTRKAMEVAANSSLELVPYAPVISQQSQARKRR